MRAPTLESIRARGPSSESEEAPEMFRVVEGGVFAGRRWQRGEVIVCRGEPRNGEPVVLAVRGRQGRPRLGRVGGTRCLGEAGEPGHPGRWRLSGRIVAVCSPSEGEGESVGDVFSAPLGGSGEGTPVELSPSLSSSAAMQAEPPQLHLFAA